LPEFSGQIPRDFIGKTTFANGVSLEGWEWKRSCEATARPAHEALLWNVEGSNSLEKSGEQPGVEGAKEERGQTFDDAVLDFPARHQSQEHLRGKPACRADSGGRECNPGQQAGDAQKLKDSSELPKAFQAVAFEFPLHMRRGEACDRVKKK
jgi:hypothetical protein